MHFVLVVRCSVHVAAVTPFWSAVKMRVLPPIAWLCAIVLSRLPFFITSRVVRHTHSLLTVEPWKPIKWQNFICGTLSCQNHTMTVVLIYIDLGM